MFKTLFGMSLPTMFFNADGGGGGGNGGGEGGNGGDNTPDKDKPFATFPDEKSFMSRVNRETKKAMEARAKELGFESAEVMEAALKAHKERQEAEKSELQRAQEAAKTAEEARQKALATANDRLVRAEFKALAAQLGVVDAEAAYQLADRSGVTVKDDGTVTGAKEALEALIKAKPYLKGSTVPPKAGEQFPGGQGGNQPTSLADAIARQYRR